MGFGSAGLGLCSKAGGSGEAEVTQLCPCPLTNTPGAALTPAQGLQQGGMEEHPESLEGKGWGDSSPAPALLSVGALLSPCTEVCRCPLSLQCILALHSSLQHRFFLPLCLCSAGNQGGRSFPSSLEGCSYQYLEEKKQLRRFASSFTPTSREKPTWSCKDREAFQVVRIRTGGCAGLGLSWQKSLAGMLRACKAAFFSGISPTVVPPSAS